ncbi:unnamed protein product [Bursaphelenchus okinawaensis]|uniref:Chitin-binding type-2 domain-containing protein n=1 Tax=Bursaphelenchus okinawaensis TaxID=465554 RepID=A0A811KT99_9BILA|nr:unnamed protein product [Bursaphelenchus okinawaensis]CAG9112298.1 unnamed protein product [Bursaphelenchus okinawaensis]
MSCVRAMTVYSVILYIILSYYITTQTQQSYWQATLGDICQLPSLPKAAGDPTKYLECVRQDIVSDRSDLGVWKLQECAEGFIFVPSAKKCKSEKFVQKQEMMCDSNKNFDFCPKLQNEYHIKKSTSESKTCKCEKEDACGCEKTQDVLQPIKVIRKSRTTHAQTQFTQAPRYRQMSTTCNNNCAKTQMIVEIYKDLTAYPFSSTPTPPASEAPSFQNTPAFTPPFVYEHSPDPPIGSANVNNLNQDQNVRQENLQNNNQPPYNNRIQDYYSQSKYQNDLNQMNAPEVNKQQVKNSNIEDQQPVQQPFQQMPQENRQQPQGNTFQQQQGQQQPQQNQNEPSQQPFQQQPNQIAYQPQQNYQQQYPYQQTQPQAPPYQPQNQQQNGMQLQQVPPNQQSHQTSLQQQKVYQPSYQPVPAQPLNRQYEHQNPVQQQQQQPQRLQRPQGNQYNCPSCGLYSNVNHNSNDHPQYNAINSNSDVIPSQSDGTVYNKVKEERRHNVIRGKHGETEYDIVITQYKGKRPLTGDGRQGNNTIQQGTRQQSSSETQHQYQQNQGYQNDQFQNNYDRQSYQPSGNSGPPIKYNQFNNANYLMEQHNTQRNRPCTSCQNQNSQNTPSGYNNQQQNYQNPSNIQIQNYNNIGIRHNSQSNNRPDLQQAAYPQNHDNSYLNNNYQGSSQQYLPQNQSPYSNINGQNQHQLNPSQHEQQPNQYLQQQSLPQYQAADQRQSNLNHQQQNQQILNPPNKNCPNCNQKLADSYNSAQNSWNQNNYMNLQQHSQAEYRYQGSNNQIQGQRMQDNSMKCQMISTKQQYCPRNDQPIIQPQPCGLVDGDSVANAQYLGICSWMLDPLAKDPESNCNFLQCQPAPNNLFCGRWQRMPCAPATAFDVNAQVCVWDALSMPGPLPPPGTTTTSVPQFNPIKISIPLPNMNPCSCKGGVQIGSCNGQFQCPGQSICQVGQSSNNRIKIKYF